MKKALKLPISKEIYDKLPMSLKLLAWHCKPEDERAFAAYLQGEHKTVSATATMLWFQDYTGVPEIVNLAAQRLALSEMNLDPNVISAKVPVHLVFDHSVRTLSGSLAENMEDEFRLNGGRMRVAKWAGKAFGIKIIPPGKGVIHQINFEKLVPVFDNTGLPVFGKGTDSHTPMVNALGVLAMGIGGAEAQMVFSGQSIGMKIPEVFAINLQNKLRPGVSSSDLAFYLKKVMHGLNGIVGSFVEVIGKGVDSLPIPARGTISNVAAEFGSRVVLFGIDQQTIDFLALSGRDENVEDLAKAYGIWRTPENEFTNVSHTRVVNIDLSTIERGISGPDQPHFWNSLSDAEAHVKEVFKKNKVTENVFTVSEVDEAVPDGALLLASIASCTHTANPDSILRAALLIKKAVEHGLTVKSWVKTAFASGSRVADQYLKKLGLLSYIEQLGFGIAAYGCGACIGQSGGLNPIGNKLLEQGLIATSIVSSNRNYPGRQDANVSISFLAAPDLVVLYAIAGRMDIDIATYDFGGGLTMADLVASEHDVAEALKVINKEMHTAAYEGLLIGSDQYEAMQVPEGPLYDWPADLLVKKPPFFDGMKKVPDPVRGLFAARTLGIFGDGFSTDAISPAGEPIQIPAVMEYLRANGITKKEDVLSLGGYRSNDDIVAAMTFSNPTNCNAMVPGVKGGYTMYYKYPEEKMLSIFEAAMRYKKDRIPLVVIGGKNYGCGSSRVMAATGPWMLGVRAIIAQSFEAIHRSNLWQNGIVPLCLPEGMSAENLILDGSETWSIPLDEIITLGSKTLTATMLRTGGQTTEVVLTVMCESDQEFDFLINGGAMQKQLRGFVTTLEEATV